jgi:hypothetical protein
MTLGPLANLFWVLPAGSLGRLQVMRVKASVLGAAIAPLFEVADDCTVSPSWLAVREALAPATGTPPVDCLLVDLEAEGAVANAGSTMAWPLARARLRERDGIVITRLDNASTSALPWRRRAVERALARAGFRDVRSYYVSPSAEDPLDLIPADASAVMAWDDQYTRPPLRRAVRRLLVRAGLHDLFFRQVLVVART